MGKKSKCKIIVLSHHKGGVSKTTLAVNLYATFERKGYKVALTDIDLQGSAIRLSQVKNKVAINDMDISKYDVVIVDTPPYLNDRTNEVLKIADLVLVPAKPNPMDCDTLPDTIDNINRIKKVNSKLKSYLIISQLDKSNTMWDDMKPFFLRLGINILTCQMSNRVAFARSILNETAIWEQPDKKGQQEMDNLVIEIENILNL